MRSVVECDAVRRLALADRVGAVGWNAGEAGEKTPLRKTDRTGGGGD